MSYSTCLHEAARFRVEKSIAILGDKNKFTYILIVNTRAVVAQQAKLWVTDWLVGGLSPSTAELPLLGPLDKTLNPIS